MQIFYECNADRVKTRQSYQPLLRDKQKRLQQQNSSMGLLDIYNYRNKMEALTLLGKIHVTLQKSQCNAAIYACRKQIEKNDNELY